MFHFFLAPGSTRVFAGKIRCHCTCPAWLRWIVRKYMNEKWIKSEEHLWSAIVSSSVTLLCVWKAALLRTIATCFLKWVVTIVFCFLDLIFQDKLYTWRSLADRDQSDIQLWLQIWSIHLSGYGGEGHLNWIYCLEMLQLTCEFHGVMKPKNAWLKNK